jgi:hypothetical protein
MEFIPNLWPQGEAQLGVRSSLWLCAFVVQRPTWAAEANSVSGSRELNPAPIGTIMADIPLAHRATRTELDSVNEAGVRRACRAEDPRVQFEWRSRELLPRICAGV